MNPSLQLDALLREIASLPKEEQRERLIDFLVDLAASLDPFNLVLMMQHFREQGSAEAAVLADVLAGELAARGF